MNVFELIKQSKRIVVFTGAGMSTDSGLPDFRSSGGLWDGKDPMEISHVDMLKKDHKSIMDFYRQRAKDALTHRPNRGHEILAEWEAKGIISSIITQNIDGYHQRAGSKNVIELHGNLGFHCPICKYEISAESYVADNRDDYCNCPIVSDTAEGMIPCGGKLRPNVVLFGEDLPRVAFSRALQRHVEADLCIVLGSSLAVYPANSLIRQTTSNEGKLVIVTRSDTEFDYLSNAKIDKLSITEFLEAANGFLAQ